jgi:(1->4)-alpha-D-glucan 1-alpha-D-glucosylmutase
VPDIYQGDELSYRALVDPDNRRPVDWGRRRELLARLRSGAQPDGADLRKLFLVERLLALRGRRPEAFEGGYEPLDAGPDACAYLRGGDVLVAVAIRAGAAGSSVTAPAGRWLDVLAGGERSFDRRAPLASLFSFPFAAGEGMLGVFERAGR